MSARVTDSLPAGRREAERRGVQLETCTGSASLPDGAHIRVSLVFFSECNNTAFWNVTTVTKNVTTMSLRENVTKTLVTLVTLVTFMSLPAS